jgi:hypothetical protein
MTSMAIAHPAHCADDCCELAKPRLRLSGLLSLLPKLPTISVVVLALGLAGCARNPAHREFNPAHRELSSVHREFKPVRREFSPVRREVRATPVRLPSHSRPNAEIPQPVELRVRRPDPALLAAQPAPNCEFKRADIKAVDPDEWARLKAEFERQCYQDAEKAARDRLGQLQASSTCEIERAPQQRPVR